jgi:hypothetical protein
MNAPQFPFNSLMVKKESGKLEFIGGIDFETRNESTARLISMADYLYTFNDFDWVVINTWDKDVCSEMHGYKVLSYCYQGDDNSRCVPDFVFDHWRQTHIFDYNITMREIAEAGLEPPETNLLGWRGAYSHPNRRHLSRFTDPNLYDIQEVQWTRTALDKPSYCSNFVSLVDAARKWRYIIDVEGQGLSGRVKLHLFGRRVLFLQERPFKEWWYPEFEPWVHYVPVASDLSDLEEKLDLIRSDSKLEDEIRFNAYDFAVNNCTRIGALERWGEVLHGL